MLLTAFSFNTQAQVLGYGVKLGSSFSYFSEDFELDGGNPGLVIGGFVNFTPIELLTLQGEIQYHLQRARIEGVPKENPNEIDALSYTSVENQNVSLNTVEVPLLATVDLPLGGVKLRAGGGASAAYNFFAWSKTELNLHYKDGTSLTAKGGEDVTSDFRRWLYAGIATVGFETDISAGFFTSLNVDFRYRQGINEIESGANVLSANRADKLTSSSIMFLVGLGF